MVGGAARSSTRSPCPRRVAGRSRRARRTGGPGRRPARAGARPGRSGGRRPGGRRRARGRPRRCRSSRSGVSRAPGRRGIRPARSCPACRDRPRPRSSGRRWRAGATGPSRRAGRRTPRSPGPRGTPSRRTSAPRAVATTPARRPAKLGDERSDAVLADQPRAVLHRPDGEETHHVAGTREHLPRGLGRIGVGVGEGLASAVAVREPGLARAHVFRAPGLLGGPGLEEHVHVPGSISTPGSSSSAGLPRPSPAGRGTRGRPRRRARGSRGQVATPRPRRQRAARGSRLDAGLVRKRRRGQRSAGATAGPCLQGSTSSFAARPVDADPEGLVISPHATLGDDPVEVRDELRIEVILRVLPVVVPAVAEHEDVGVAPVSHVLDELRPASSERCRRPCLSKPQARSKRTRPRSLRCDR